MMTPVTHAPKPPTTLTQTPLQGIGGTPKLRDTLRRLVALLFAEGVCVHGKVPSERRLCELTGVSRRTIRNALLELDRLNVTRRVGPRTRMLNEWSRDFLEAPPEARVKPTDPTDPTAPPLLRQTVLLVRHRLIPIDKNPEHFRGRPSHFGEAFQEYAYRHDRPVLQMRPGLLMRHQERELGALPVAGAVLTEDAACLDDAPELIRRLRSAGIPVVVVSDLHAFPGADTVRSNHVTGAYQLTRWLLDHAGPRLVQFWTDHGRSGDPSAGVWVRAREEGYRKAMTAAGLTPAEPIIATHPSIHPQESKAWFEAMVRAAAHRLQEPCRSGLDGVLAGSDALVGVVAAALRRLGVEPGKDVRLAGYDNFWRTYFTRRYERTAPDVTIDKRHGRMAAVALGLLDQRLAAANGRSTQAPTADKLRRVKPRLVVP
jgi:DNA-binding LacI/PurR family transcriptional regulator